MPAAGGPVLRLPVPRDVVGHTTAALVQPPARRCVASQMLPNGSHPEGQAQIAAQSLAQRNLIACARAPAGCRCAGYRTCAALSAWWRRIVQCGRAAAAAAAPSSMGVQLVT